MPDYSGEAGGHLVLPPPFRLYFHRVDFGFQPASLYQYAPQVLGLEGSLVIGANGFGGFLQLPSGQTFNWNGDAGLSRIAAGILGLGNGTQGDFSGTLKLLSALLSSLGVVSWNGDTGISRGLAGRIYVGNGTQGDRTGSVEGTNFQVQNGGGYFLKDASSGTPNLICQNDNNIVLYSTDAAGASRAIWSVFAHSGSSAFTVNVPMSMNGTAPVSWNSDTGLSRDSAGVIDVGNATQGDKSGSLQATSYRTASSNPAASGTVRLAAADTIAFRNTGNSADIALSKNGYDQITATGLSNRILQNFTSTALTGAGGLSFQAAASKTIKANSLGAHGALLIRLAGSGVTASGGLANITVQFGGTNKTVLSVPGSTTFTFRLEATLANQNATGTQLITWTSQYNSTLATQSNNTYSIDTTADQTLSLGVIFNNASDNCTFQNMLVELMPASAAI